MIWKEIAGYNAEYKLSSEGDVVRTSLMRQKSYIVKPTVTKTGLKVITLYKGYERKALMLHNVYAQTFDMPVEQAKKILYRGFKGNQWAPGNVKDWLEKLIAEKEKEQSENKKDYHDEILYLKEFIRSLE